MWELFGLLGAIVVTVLVTATLLVRRRPSSREPSHVDEPVLAAAEKELAEMDEKDWVVLTRFSGPAYTHNAMSEIIGELSSQGVEATYDVISTSMAEAGVTNYMLKVVRGQEQQAWEILKAMGKSSPPSDESNDS